MDNLIGAERIQQVGVGSGDQDTEAQFVDLSAQGMGNDPGGQRIERGSKFIGQQQRRMWGGMEISQGQGEL